MINCVLRFSNNIVLVFDEEGEQIPEYQGRYEEVKAKVLAHAPKSAQFFHSGWPTPGSLVPRKEW